MLPLLLIVASSIVASSPWASRVAPHGSEGAIVPSSSLSDFNFADGASASGGPHDDLCSGANVRSGNPGAVSRIQLDHPLLAPGYEVAALHLSFRYAAGFTPPPGKAANASTVQLLLLDAAGTATSLYSSPPLGNYSYDHFKGYSPPIPISATDLHVANEKLLFIVLEVHNRARNLQIPIDDLRGGWNVSVTWNKL